MSNGRIVWEFTLMKEAYLPSRGFLYAIFQKEQQETVKKWRCLLSGSWGVASSVRAVSESLRGLMGGWPAQ
jgi:hypothetical protein